MRWVKGLLVLLLLIPVVGYSWVEERCVEGGGTFRDACFLNEYLWAVGDEGLVARWEMDYNLPGYSHIDLDVTPPITQSDWNFKGICVIGPHSDILFIVGEKVGERTGIILRSTDDGNTWTATYPSADGYDLACFSIDYANSNILYMGCSRGYILKTTDGGGEWNKTLRKPIETGNDKHADCFVSIWVDKTDPQGEKVWAVADNSGLIVKTVNGGQSWYHYRDEFPNSEWQVDPGWGVEYVKWGQTQLFDFFASKTMQYRITVRKPGKEFPGRRLFEWSL